LSNPQFQNPGPLSSVADGHWMASNISVYPNPSSHFLTVTSPELDGPVEASLVSSSGAILWRKTEKAENGRLQLDVTGAVVGAYTLELRSGSVQKFCKVVVDH